MRFWDVSAVVPLLVWQPATDSVSAIRASDPEIVVWWGTVVECTSALARLKRMGLLDESRARAAYTNLKNFAESWIEVEPSEPIRILAGDLLATHDLTSGDAFQLAAALRVPDAGSDLPEFVCLDRRLRLSAKNAGFAVLPDASVAREPAPFSYASAARRRAALRR